MFPLYQHAIKSLRNICTADRHFKPCDLFAPCGAAWPVPQQWLVPMRAAQEADQEVAANVKGSRSGQRIIWHEIQHATSLVVFKKDIREDGNVDEGMTSANTRRGVDSIFVAVGMNKRIIHLNHACIIKTEFSSLIRVEEHGDVEGVNRRRTE